jgi:hypothetical protein
MTQDEVNESTFLTSIATQGIVLMDFTKIP